MVNAKDFIRWAAVQGPFPGSMPAQPTTNRAPGTSSSRHRNSEGLPKRTSSSTQAKRAGTKLHESARRPQREQSPEHKGSIAIELSKSMLEEFRAVYLADRSIKKLEDHLVQRGSPEASAQKVARVLSRRFDAEKEADRSQGGEELPPGEPHVETSQNEEEPRVDPAAPRLSRAEALAAMGLPGHARSYRVLGFQHAPFDMQALESELAPLRQRQRKAMTMLKAGRTGPGVSLADDALDSLAAVRRASEEKIEQGGLNFRQARVRFQEHPCWTAIEECLRDANNEFGGAAAAEMSRIEELEKSLGGVVAWGRIRERSDPLDSEVVKYLGLKSPTPTSHEILGLKPTADATEIRKAWRALALRCHPDRNEPKDRAVAAQALNLVNDAHEKVSAASVFAAGLKDAKTRPSA